MTTARHGSQRGQIVQQVINRRDLTQQRQRIRPRLQHSGRDRLAHGYQQRAIKPS